MFSIQRQTILANAHAREDRALARTLAEVRTRTGEAPPPGADDPVYLAVEAVTHVSYEDYLRDKKAAEIPVKEGWFATTPVKEGWFAATPTSTPASASSSAPSSDVSSKTKTIKPTPTAKSSSLSNRVGAIALVVGVVMAIAGVIYWKFK